MADEDIVDAAPEVAEEAEEVVEEEVEMSVLDALKEVRNGSIVHIGTPSKVDGNTNTDTPSSTLGVS
jgi:hypothetical protein